MKSYELYIKTDCKFCKKAIDLLSLKGVPFVAIVCDKDPIYLEAKKQDYGWPTVPIVIEQNDAEKKVIGGCDELEKELLNG